MTRTKGTNWAKNARGHQPDAPAQPVPPPPRPKREVAVERVVQFRASDGTMHATYAAAIKHEGTVAFGKWLADWLEEHSYREQPDADKLAAAIRNQWNVTRKKLPFER
jgi:hypothetical protein